MNKLCNKNLKQQEIPCCSKRIPFLMEFKEWVLGSFDSFIFNADLRKALYDYPYLLLNRSQGSQSRAFNVFSEEEDGRLIYVLTDENYREITKGDILEVGLTLLNKEIPKSKEVAFRLFNSIPNLEQMVERLSVYEG